MSSAGGRRRSLLANAIESIGTTPVPTPTADAPVADDITVREKPAEDTATPSFLERRGIAFDEIARTVKRPTIRLKPSECSIWPGNARDYAALSYDRCASLIESIREEGTNREPVVVRRTPNAEQSYELIVGTRRHFSVSWLHANNHSEIELVARIETLDDEGAFRLADLENREREDVTDLERARNYRHAVEAYYNGVRTQMAERLAIPKQNLHNLLQLAELPDEVVSAFAEPGDLKVRHGMRLSPLLKDDRYRDAILAEAGLIIAEQEKLRATGADKIEGSKVCERLAAAVTPARQAPSPKAKPALTAASGKEIGQVLADTKAKGITININPKGGGASVDEILDALRPVIESARFAR
ncbi:ParB family chromosome partitioning protein [Sphingobium wenxiniae]|uniref:ParB family chromosome partitioning protein n=1 Tax=Sphingobium wenxiniae (strain DSM 21828 / CGMCC 1.7748 / JZ-1) TaxID=595605 RepID=A0A562K1V5_SPHWJ|nr:ParB/RepB/Spo0J family partition protein [Sphingobium wenxiniae]MBB6193718.1 ParB family chromosome partitioning protein [Sphingobium wenxiniae]TWH89409.1 ParB family chromosome partitioning protein [Sphingobium wenxiniae]